MSIGKLEVALSLVEKLKDDGTFPFLVDAFNYLADKEYREGLNKAGSLTAEDMIKINERVLLLQMIAKLDIVLSNEIKSLAFIKKENPFKSN